MTQNFKVDLATKDSSLKLDAHLTEDQVNYLLMNVIAPQFSTIIPIQNSQPLKEVSTKEPAKTKEPTSAIKRVGVPTEHLSIKVDDKTTNSQLEKFNKKLKQVVNETVKKAGAQNVQAKPLTMDERIEAFARGMEETASTVTPIEQPLIYTNTIADAIGDQINDLYPKHEPSEDEKPDFLHTGVKYKEKSDGKVVPHFRLFYSCPKCHNSGRHYIAEYKGMNERFVSCHNCQTKLLVEPATEKGFAFAESHRDENGNYYKADRIYVDRSPNYSRN